MYNFLPFEKYLNIESKIEKFKKKRNDDIVVQEFELIRLYCRASQKNAFKIFLDLSKILQIVFLTFRKSNSLSHEFVLLNTSVTIHKMQLSQYPKEKSSKT